MPAARKERADAVRNRETVLAAAGRLLDATDDPDQVSMDDIAKAAGVGKGTLFRGFGDRIGLLQALAVQRSAALLPAAGGGGDAESAGNAAGAAGNGTPADRAIAIFDAILAYKQANRSLALALESAGRGSPYLNPAYDELHRHLAGIISGVRGPDDADYLAHALLAAVRSDLLHQLRDEPPERIRAGVVALIRAVLD
ncbi:TetR/AcrR family transcriptional regulator [Micromonospora sp. NBC_01813]|uniref:TetR/AcrR family transcriptional regulator n=1 Tax=Micromonospora sp. NBC_01813 TaxID=2975988 RepID=UPI002DDB4404|nr:helix-turn-helix domain-containing protein [Micromonospora sp. NBC_01813]WSA08147.1 TetR/AcrR family transcriptional regulator [Micromonospora sp. NBC_01813]